MRNIVILKCTKFQQKILIREKMASLFLKQPQNATSQVHTNVWHTTPVTKQRSNLQKTSTWLTLTVNYRLKSLESCYWPHLSVFSIHDAKTNEWWEKPGTGNAEMWQDLQPSGQGFQLPQVHHLKDADKVEADRLTQRPSQTRPTKKNLPSRRQKHCLEDLEKQEDDGQAPAAGPTETAACQSLKKHCEKKAENCGYQVLQALQGYCTHPSTSQG